MYHEQLIAHVISRRALGVPDDEIRHELGADNWSSKDIELAFYYVDNPEKNKHFSLQRILQSEVKVSTFLLVLVCGIVIISTYLFIFYARPVNYELVTPQTVASSTATLTYGPQPALSSPDFFLQVKNQFLAERATFVEVDLSQMMVRVFSNGNQTLEVPVKTKGREGSWWETPAGLYKIETKERSHYSTMGHVTQPWSMQFQGNFFIHGWPKYDNGSPVASTFSGGCIRLSDEDAKKIYDAITIGTPILVYEKDFIPDTFTYISPKPVITSPSFIVADIRNNQILLHQQKDESIPAGSITKLMTALIATEYINIEKTVTVPAAALVQTTTPRLKVGSKITIYQLLFPLLTESSNEAAETIARAYGRSLFIEHMNKKALSLGMKHTTFADPTGLSQENTTTPEDIFILAKYIYNNRSFIFNITSGKVRTTTYGNSIFTNLGKANSLLLNEHFFGGTEDNNESGHGYNLAIFEIPIHNQIRPLFFLAVGPKNTSTDVSNMLSFIETFYK